jgi:(4S)-4-hydroxy-5-phosphonooxypentane-2,3-dione isomerase
MLVVHVHARVHSERVAEFLAATKFNAEASLAEPGVLRFDVLQDEADPAHVILTEVYRDDDAAAAHKLTQHYATWRDAVAEMMAEPRSSQRYSAVFPAEESGWQSGPSSQSSQP